MEELKEQTKKVLTDYFNTFFEDNVYDLLMMTNRKRGELDVDIIKSIIVTYKNYVETKSEDDMYLCKDAVVELWNDILKKEKEVF